MHQSLIKSLVFSGCKMVKRFKKILVANRGEIALRVIRAACELGIKTVAVYSEVDRASLHVQAADEAVNIGPPAPLESYLNIKNIIKVGKKFKCNAVHPGYGFLAENAKFAHQCEKAGVVFIGPNSQALSLVGDKLRSRQTMAKAEIPLIPGMNSAEKSDKALIAFADDIGYPVMIKASGGGGGKGMRIVQKPADLLSSVEAGRREAKAAFGDETIYLEKYIEKPRHIEFQVLADNYGNVVHLFERECSIQRRYQKIIEETPSPALNEKLRLQMGEVAKKVMRLSQYNNAGTVEFLLDEQKNFYFLEVNARIQVEHPITELVTGIDLVKQQIKIAEGEKLSFRQDALIQRGHSIECRIYAEDPENNFFPSFGKLHFIKEPTGPGIRCDSGIFTGWEVPYHYDPILSKLIVWDEDRKRAIQKMAKALSDYIIMGVKTQIPFLMDLIRHSDFIKGNLHTHFIQQNFAGWKPKQNVGNLSLALLCAALANANKKIKKEETTTKTTLTPWQLTGRWELLSKYSK
jgi:acetyl-CoA carboxylase biotin carboxylase subunit